MSVFTNPSSRTPEESAAYVAAVRELLGPRDPMAVLDETVSLIQSGVAQLTERDAKQVEAEGKWSVASVVQHLADAELVWACRIRVVLAGDRTLLTGWDQDQWAQRLRYYNVDLHDALGDFVALRRMNLRLLRRVGGDDLHRVAIHAERGPESGWDILAQWAG